MSVLSSVIARGTRAAQPAATAVSAGSLYFVTDEWRTERSNGATWDLFGLGRAVQTVNSQTGAVATGTTLIPYDDTIPQNTEGDQYLSLAITPTNAASKLKIDVVLSVSTSAAARNIIAALFQDTTANALAAMTWTEASATFQHLIAFTHYMTAGTTSATTFKVRAGLDNAGTLTVNGSNSARKLGGVLASSITITEIAA